MPLPALLLAALLAVPQRETGLIVFEDDDFAGRTITLLGDTPDLRLSGMDKRISSLRVASGETWELCTSRDYGGSCKLVTGNETSLRRINMNDKIESVRRVRSGGSRPVSGVGYAPTSGLVLFGGPNFGGSSKELDGAVADLSKDGNFNDRAMSLRVARGEEWDVCVSANYVDCRVVTGDVATLDSIGLVRNISSARPRGFGRGGGSSGGQTGSRITIYELPNFAGRSATLTGTEFQLSVLNNRAGSVRVTGGRWEVCDQPRFGGRCSTFTGDIRDLNSYGLKDRILSVRPR